MTNLDSVVRELKAERDRIDTAIQTLTALSSTTVNGASRPQPGRKTMSAAARARISASQKARWAKRKGPVNVVPIGSRTRRKISPAGLARIRAAQRARWAKLKAGKK